MSNQELRVERADPRRTAPRKGVTRRRGLPAGPGVRDATPGPAHIATPRPDDKCYVCERPRTAIPGELVRLFGRWACRDRVDCYHAWRPDQ